MLTRCLCGRKRYRQLHSESKPLVLLVHACCWGSWIYAAGRWSPDDIDGRDYDYLGLSQAADYLFVMNYDTRSAIYGRCIASANAPLAKMERGIERYLDLGVSPAKLIYGLPWYACLPSPSFPTSWQ